MHKGICLLLLVLLGLLSTLPPAHAESKRWALVVGVEEYENSDINRFRFADKDASTVSEALQTRLGYQTRLMTSALKVGDPNRPTNLNILKALDRLAEQAGPDDTFLFYFAGYGVRKEGQNFLAAVNTDASSVETLQLSAIPVTTLEKKIQKLRARQILFVMDAFRTAMERGKETLDSPLTSDFTKSLMVAAHSQNAPAGSSAVLLACSEGERAFEDPEHDHSVFTLALLDALQGKAKGNGPLTLTAVANSVQTQVGNWAHSHNKKQTPLLKTVGTADMLLADKILPAEKTHASGQVGETKINPKDGATMIFIPAGPFLMGDDDDQIKDVYTGVRNNPRHTVTLSGYWIYRDLVTVGMYKKFCQETGRQMPPDPVIHYNPNLGKEEVLVHFNPKWEKEDQPIVNVSWEDAMAYCQWAGVALPTEAQWEKAARGADGRKFPWGDTFDASKLWFSKSAVGDAGGTHSVGELGVSPYGCTDMAGNVWQWCADYYDASFLGSPAALGPDPVNRNVGDQKERVLRGGAWNCSSLDYLFRTAYRIHNAPIARFISIGFRCAR